MKRLDYPRVAGGLIAGWPLVGYGLNRVTAWLDGWGEAGYSWNLWPLGAGSWELGAELRPQAAARTTAAAPPENPKWRLATSLHKKSIIQYSKYHFFVNRVRDPFGEGSGHCHSQPQPNMARELPASCHHQLPADWPPERNHCFLKENIGFQCKPLVFPRKTIGLKQNHRFS